MAGATGGKRKARTKGHFSLCSGPCEQAGGHDSFYALLSWLRPFLFRHISCPRGRKKYAKRRAHFYADNIDGGEFQRFGPLCSSFVGTGIELPNRKRTIHKGRSARRYPRS